MGRYLVIVLVSIGIVSIAGCGIEPIVPIPSLEVTDQASPTPVPVTETIPSATELPPVESETLSPTSTLTPEIIPTETVTLAPPTLSPTGTGLVEATSFPEVDPFAAAIQIFAPGPMSKVSSPIDLRLYIAPRATGLTIVELFGEDGRLMARNVLRSVNYNQQFDKVLVELPFETNAAAELGRLQITTKDDFGREQAIKSVHIMLLSVGSSVITNPAYLRESVALVEPPLSHYITGGEVAVQGRMQVFNEIPVIIELIGREGEVLGSRIVVPGPADGQYHEIDTSVPYQVTQYTNARLVIRQSDNRIPGPFYLYSQEVYLSP